MPDLKYFKSVINITQIFTVDKIDIVEKSVLFPVSG